MSFPALRKRMNAANQNTISGAIVRIMAGVFGTGSPFAGVAQVDPRPSTPIYQYHQGDLFTPGSGNYVFEPTTELPVQTIWGIGFLRKPNTFNPIQPPQVWIQSTLSPNGIGGIVAGDVELQPLINPEGDLGPFTSDWNYDDGIK